MGRKDSTYKNTIFFIPVLKAMLNVEWWFCCLYLSLSLFIEREKKLGPILSAPGKVLSFFYLMIF